MTEVLSRDDARAKGLKRFYTGVPCRNGHVDDRYTSTGQCFSCLSNANKKRYARDPQQFIDRSAGWRKKNPDAYALSSRKHYYMKSYGLTLEEVETLRAGVKHCPGCGETFENKASHIDHCHATGRVRGILCGPCNQTLGLVKDNSDTLERLIAYLKAEA